MEPRLRDGEINDTVDILTKGLLRTLLVLLHDFPDYLSENHFTLCNYIPPGCVQLKNLVLSAFPRMKRLPDPFMPGLKMESIDENKAAPQLSVNIAAILDSVKIRAPLDKYLQSRFPEDFPRKLVERIKFMSMENGDQNGVPKRPRYDVDLLNAIVLYIGMQATETAQKNDETGVLIFEAKNPQMELLSALNSEVDIDGNVSLRLANL
jgi:CCR4-NOT transcription complex subunit 1